MTESQVTDPVFFFVHRLSRSLMRGSMAYYTHAFGLGVPQMQVLQSLSKAGTLVSRDIAHITEMNKALVSRSLSELSAKGLIQDSDDPDDARRRVWRLTDAGRTLAGRYAPVGHDRRMKLLNVLSAEEQALFVETLKKLYLSSEALIEEEKAEIARAPLRSDGTTGVSGRTRA